MAELPDNQNPGNDSAIGRVAGIYLGVISALYVFLGVSAFLSALVPPFFLLTLPFLVLTGQTGLIPLPGTMGVKVDLSDLNSGPRPEVLLIVLPTAAIIFSIVCFFALRKIREQPLWAYYLVWLSGLALGVAMLNAVFGDAGRYQNMHLWTWMGSPVLLFAHPLLFGVMTYLFLRGHTIRLNFKAVLATLLGAAVVMLIFAWYVIRDEQISLVRDPAGYQSLSGEVARWQWINSHGIYEHVV